MSGLRSFIVIFLLHHKIISSFVNLSSSSFPTTSRKDAARSIVLRRTTKRQGASNSVWDRLGLEEDDEPLWYILNCVAGNEIDLLNQCNSACDGFAGGDVMKFVVPTVSSVRSHGASRMVNEVKVKYPGYVFGKLRLCKQVYETIQSLDLCRSWMGTVNHKGNRKLPPAPLALNEVEIEKFGLECIENVKTSSSTIAVGDDVIVDLPEGTDETNLQLINPASLKVYRGLKVEDMVKVTSQNKFFNEDGIVRRLKEGKVLVRFFTYGSVYEEWLQPSDVRKLSSMEILRGLAGPGRPVTQQDLDAARHGITKDYISHRVGDSESISRQVLAPRAAESRNRRQDRIVNKFKSRDVSVDEKRRDERNWNWYKEQQSQAGERKRGADSWTSASKVDTDAGELQYDGPRSQWSRKSQPLDDRKASHERKSEVPGGKVEWSSFVSTNTHADRPTKSADSFFDSLMGGLAIDLSREDCTTEEEVAFSAFQGEKNDEEDFFASLMSDLTPLGASSHQHSGSKPGSSTAALTKGIDETADDNFFSSLLSTLLPDQEPPLSPQEIKTDVMSGEISHRTLPVGEYGDTSVPPDPSLKPSRRIGEDQPLDLDKCTVPDLRALLRNRGLKVSGKKSELIERLAKQ